MTEFRMQQPLLFWAGTVLAVGAASYGVVLLVSMVFLVSYSASTVAECDLLLSPLQYAAVTWLPWAALTVPLAALAAVFVSALCAKLPSAASLILLFVGTPLALGCVLLLGVLLLRACI